MFSGTTIEIGILLNKSGEEEKRINYGAYQDEIPVFDFHQLATPVRIRGISATHRKLLGVEQWIRVRHELSRRK